MKTVAQLQALGFTVRPADDAVSCTEVVSDKPFWFYNPRFHSDMASIQANLKAADRRDNLFRLVSAGDFTGDQRYPFVLIDAYTKASLDCAFAEHRHMQEEAKKWATNYMATLATSFWPAEVSA